MKNNKKEKKKKRSNNIEISKYNDNVNIDNVWK